MSVLSEPDWPLPAGVRLGWTGKSGGVSQGPFAALNLAHHVGDESASVKQNRERLQAAMPGCERVRWLSQVHGCVVQDAARVDDGSEADAAFTREAGLACVVMTADCLPVFFWTPSGDTIGCAHAGWRGLAGGVLAATLGRFADPGQVSVGFGPAIGPTAFEVGEDVVTAFAEWPDRDACFQPGEKPGKYLADLAGLAEQQLAALGVRACYRSDACTFTESDQYFSYRRDGQTGRMANVIWKPLL
ncbi:MAG: peptidoglycan editing factor PgeF [Saccharospirillum sp.]